MKKLVCDRCGFELTYKEDVDQALEGQMVWEAAVRARGGEPRGVFPCENYRNCGGEMKVVTTRRRLMMKLAGKEKPQSEGQEQ